MSRIRSIHPGLWTDDAFMSLSPLARLLYIGLWNEAFDDGVFEWKTRTLKAKIFPGDGDIDMDALLAEIVAAGSIAERDDPKHYGLVRNFRHFQRPKKPNSSGLLRDEDREYVGLGEDQSGTGSGTGTEIVEQREDVGDKMKEEDRTSPPVIDAEAQQARALFDELWKVFPQNPSSSDVKAEAAFRATKASDQPLILAAARHHRLWFVEDCEARKRSEAEGSRYVPHLATWISTGEWRKAGALPLKNAPSAPDPSLVVIAADTEEFKAVQQLRGKSPIVGKNGTTTVTKAELHLALAAA